MKRYRYIGYSSNLYALNKNAINIKVSENALILKNGTIISVPILMDTVRSSGRQGMQS